MIELRDITFRYETEHPVLDHIDLTVAEGELVLLAGPTGAGKSTLLGVVSGLVPAFSGGTLRGDVLLDGLSILDVPARDRAHTIGYVGQNPPSWFVTDTVEEELAFGMEQLGLAPATMRRRVEETLDLLGIADLRHRDLRTLSGGQQQRVAIGSVLTMHPRLLVLDEPTSALDPTAAEDVLATLTRLVHDLGVSVLLAEHRLERVVPFSDRMALLGAVPGRPGGLRVGEPAVMLRDAPIAPPIIELGRLAGWDPLPLTVREARRRAPQLRARLAHVEEVAQSTPDVEEVDLETVAARPPRSKPQRPSRDADPTVAVRRLVVAHGRTPVLHGVDLALRPGTVTALMGRNGAGKSTLLWTLQGRLGAQSGSVVVAGGDPHASTPEQRRATTGLVPQSPADLLYLETVEEECAAADDAARTPGRTRALLDRIAPGIEPDQHPRDLSEGQRLALAVAIVLAARPPVLLLDEPTRGLDYPAKAALATVLRDLAMSAVDQADQRRAPDGEPGLGRTILIATHDVEFVARVADDLVVLAEGEIVSHGPVARTVSESPAFAPQVTKVLGNGWLTVDQVRAALRPAAAVEGGLR